jgi:hypothetical protein
MSQDNYDESIQHRRTHKAVGAIPVAYGLEKKKKPLPVVGVAPYIIFDPSAKTYHARISRRLFKRASPTFSTLKAAIEWRDNELASAPKGEKGLRCCILKNKPL